MTVQGIYGFFDDFRFLSNFEGPGFFWAGNWYQTNEHYYQARKADNWDDHAEIRLAASPGSAKRRGRSVTIRPDWESIKDSVMRTGLALKFDPERNPKACEMLLATGYHYLEETNYWNDIYWGVCEGHGLNRLGIMLMERRGALR